MQSSFVFIGRATTGEAGKLSPERDPSSIG
jgi:hypothetical protein